MKIPRLQNYCKKNPAEAHLEDERVTKAGRSASELTFAGNTRQVGSYDGVDMYVDDEEEKLNYEEFDFVELRTRSTTRKQTMRQKDLQKL